MPSVKRNHRLGERLDVFKQTRLMRISCAERIKVEPRSTIVLKLIRTIFYFSEDL